MKKNLKQLKSINKEEYTIVEANQSPDYNPQQQESLIEVNIITEGNNLTCNFVSYDYNSFTPYIYYVD